MRYHAHKLIRDTARGMAEVVYESIMKDNNIYANWKAMCPELEPDLARKRFVILLYPRLLEEARHTLAQMLDKSYPEVLKEQIHDALVKDNLFREGRLKALAEKLN